MSDPNYEVVNVQSVLETIGNDVLAKSRVYARSGTGNPPCQTTSSRLVAETVMCALFDAIFGPRTSDERRGHKAQ